MNLQYERFGQDWSSLLRKAKQPARNAATDADVLTPIELRQLGVTLPDWQVLTAGLSKSFAFPSRREGAAFVAAVFAAANAANHHPDVQTSGTTVTVTWVTHAVGDRITSRDVAGATTTDKLAQTAQRLELESRPSGVISLPDVTDVSFPTMIGAVPAKPKRRKPYIYQGVKLSRPPTVFEARVLDLPGMVQCLDDATVQAQMSLTSGDDAGFQATVARVAERGATYVGQELGRQGASSEDIALAETSDVAQRVSGRALLTLAQRLADIRAYHLGVVQARKVAPQRVVAIADKMVGLRRDGVARKVAASAINEAFAAGRAAAIYANSRVAAFHLASGSGLSQRRLQGIRSGRITVDVVTQTAVMDDATCTACADTDGEEFDFGSDRQEELLPPYVECYSTLGGTNYCRCLQIALLSDGTEVEVDELPDEAESTDDADDDDDF